MNPTKQGIIVQARLGSSRYPYKVLERINNKSLLQILFSRLKKSNSISNITFAIPDNKENFPLQQHIKEFGGEVFLGNEDDVMLRYFECAKKQNLDTIVRITSDCPLIDYREIDKFIEVYNTIDFDNLYLSNFTPPDNSSYCNGSDIEIFSKNMLEEAIINFNNKKDREHVTFQFWDGRFSCRHLKMHWEGKEQINKIRITVDYKEDIEVIKRLEDVIDLEKASLEEICQKYLELNLNLINGNFDSKAGWI